MRGNRPIRKEVLFGPQARDYFKDHSGNLPGTVVSLLETIKSPDGMRTIDIARFDVNLEISGGQVYYMEAMFVDKVLENWACHIERATFSPDSRHIAYAAWSPKAAPPLRTIEGDDEYDTITVRESPGPWFVYVDQQPLGPFSDVGDGPIFSPDCAHVAFVIGTGRSNEHPVTGVMKQEYDDPTCWHSVILDGRRMLSLSTWEFDIHFNPNNKLVLGFDTVFIIVELSGSSGTEQATKTDPDVESSGRTRAEEHTPPSDSGMHACPRCGSTEFIPSRYLPPDGNVPVLRSRCCAKCGEPVPDWM